ncbi:hypothetical protein FQP90_13145 [Paenarthrobacter nitroguajacolicus]|uniref:Uncharacterized protein n=1 Tax=Paenarthrobacter nitroguajacolicus TaxID=211146 RepID=A0A558GYU0_PAENT|nr:DUF6153 family protein [Paenarthrobacter nitroguajacolicus]TVU62006.1 hypothetical protein FQP90_13145 [Paenarthrobacter nitroguajacolicus]
MAAQRAITGSALLTASLIAGILALITGILGMHVMTGTQSVHSSAMASADMTETTGTGSSTSGIDASGHASHLVSSPEPAALQELSVSNGAASPAQCSCSGNCSSQHSMSTSCIPTVSAGGLTAPAPDDTVSTTEQSAVPTFTARVPWSYRPVGPSPGELSISRT